MKAHLSWEWWGCELRHLLAWETMWVNRAGTMAFSVLRSGSANKHECQSLRNSWNYQVAKTCICFHLKSHHFCFWALGVFDPAVLALLPVEPQQMCKGRGWGMEDDGSGSDSALECSLVTGLPGVLCQCWILQLRWERVLQPDHWHVPRLPQVRAGWRALHGNFSFFCCWGEHTKH